MEAGIYDAPPPLKGCVLMWTMEASTGSHFISLLPVCAVDTCAEHTLSQPGPGDRVGWRVEGSQGSQHR